jgi:tricorn protease-like protein
MSGDGRIVAFQSAASNLVAGDGNGTSDVFAHDRKTGVTSRISVASDGGDANGPSTLSFFGGSTGANGRLIAFSSAASNLVDGDANGFDDAFVRDRKSGTTTRVSVASDGAAANGTSAEAALSDNGRYVAFVSDATNLVDADGNGQDDIFVHDLKTGRTERVNVASDGTEANGRSRGAALSSDGRYVTFVSSASNLVADDTNGVDDVFVHDRKTGTTVRASVDSSGAQGNGATSFGVISGNGKAVALQSLATNLVADDTNGAVDVFVRTLK